MLVHSNGPYDEEPKVAAAMALQISQHHASVLYLATDQRHEGRGCANVVVKWSLLAAQTSSMAYVLASAGNDVSAFWQKQNFHQLTDTDLGSLPEVENAAVSLSWLFDNSTVLILRIGSQHVAKTAFDLACETLGSVRR